MFTFGLLMREERIIYDVDSGESHNTQLLLQGVICALMFFCMFREEGV